MRDFAPRAAAARRRIAETLLEVFERWGFARVITPAFEYEEVLALGLGDAGRAAAIRFVEPSSGQVVALRPDITPQIARLIATRFRDEQGPVRLCYEGTVVRLERAGRGQRELIQTGVELAGVASPEGDAEVIALGVAALAAAGLQRPTIDLGHLGLAREVLSALELPAPELDEVRRRIAKRDRSGLEEILVRTNASAGVKKLVMTLPELSGSPAILGKLRKNLPKGAQHALAELREIVAAVEALSVDACLHVDLGEVRGFDYYTGVRFQAFVPGAPDAVLAGGRYDDLLARYGRASPAVGFAIDVEAAASALEAADVEPRHANGAGNGNGGVLVTGPLPAAARTADELRRGGRRAIAELAGLTGGELDAYARRWGYTEIVRVHERGARRKQ
jgi:ATP phosphoribosyltransferase regulatory subunit